LPAHANLTGYKELVRWARSFDNLLREGAKGQVSMMQGFSERSQRRFQRKSDSTDAESAARAFHSGKALTIAMSQKGATEALRTLPIARRSAVKWRTQVFNHLLALLSATNKTSRDKLWHSKPDQCVKACSKLETLGGYGCTSIIGYGSSITG
jgi:transposase